MAFTPTLYYQNFLICPHTLNLKLFNLFYLSKININEPEYSYLKVLSSIFHILLKESILEILKNVFPPLFIQSVAAFSILCPQFPDSNGKNEKGIY